MCGFKLSVVQNDKDFIRLGDEADSKNDADDKERMLGHVTRFNILILINKSWIITYIRVIKGLNFYYAMIK